MNLFSTGRLVFIVGLLGVPANEVHAQATLAAAAAPDTTALAVVRAYFAAYNATMWTGHPAAERRLYLVEPVRRLHRGGGTWCERHPILARPVLSGFTFGNVGDRDRYSSRALVTVRERARWQSTAGPRSQAAISVYEVRAGLLRRVWYYPVVKDHGEPS